MGDKGKTVDLYELLRVERTASATEIRKAYYLLARKVHPDKNRDDPNAEENFKALQQAYEILKDTEKRKHYDRTGDTSSDSASFWSAYHKYKSVEITEKDIEEYLSSFRSSDSEKADVVSYCISHQGDVSKILSTIIGSKDSDIDRFISILEQAFENGQIDVEYKHAFEDSKKAVLTMEQLEAAEDIGEEDDEGEDLGDSEDEDDMEDFIVNEDEGESEEQSEADSEEESEEEESEEDEKDTRSNAAKFKQGDQVEARWRKGPKFYAGVVVDVQKKGKKNYKYSVQFHDDGSTEEDIDQKMIRINKKPPPKEKRAPKRKSTKPPPQKQPKASSKTKRAKVEEDYDGDLDALRASILGKASSRSAAFSDFEERWKGK